MDSLDPVLVIGGDEVLDAALARHGLPRLGGDRPAPASAALIRFVIEAAFTPMDPADLHALLCLDPGPVPRSIAWRLARALNDFPGRGSPDWREALDNGLAAIEEDRRAAVAERLRTLLMPAAPRSGRVAAAEITRRLRALSTWAHRRAEHEPSLWSAARVAASACELIELLGQDAFTRVELRRLCDELEQAGGGAGEAGLAGAPAPSAVLGPADVVIWWDFSRDRAPPPPRLRLSEAERAALEAAGVTPPDRARAMEAEATRWRRPLDMATQALILVCPRTNAAGETNFPHPLWDELAAATTDVARLEATRLHIPARARRAAASLRALPAPAPTARAGRALTARDPESPSSIERLLGCSLSWTLHYHGRLEPGLSAGPGRPTPLLLSSLAHLILSQVFAEGPLPT